MLYNTHALSHFRETVHITTILFAKISLVASNVYVSLDIKVTTKVAQMKMNAVLEDLTAVHMQIA